MKKILKKLPVWIMGTISFIVLTLMNLAWVLLALLIKLISLIFAWFIAALKLNDDTDTVYHGVTFMGNEVMNICLKVFINLLYPINENEKEGS